MKPPSKVIRSATRADLEALPSTWRGEIIDGTLRAFPRRPSRHARIEGLLRASLLSSPRRGRGAGGWWILPEPGIEVTRSPRFSPDLAGWRVERMAGVPPENEVITVVPDWVCEILSPGTASYDSIVKRRFYAEIGVAHLWTIDPARLELEVCRIVHGRWLQLGVHGADETVRAEPFEAVEVTLAEWWEGIDEDEEPGE